MPSKKEKLKELRVYRKSINKCTYCGKNPIEQGGSLCERCKERQTTNRFKRKIKAFLHYGDACQCCGEKILAFLTIDHINNDGAEHRKTVKNIYDWLIQNNYPEGFRIRCRNCNSGANINKGECPHEQK